MKPHKGRNKPRQGRHKAKPGRHLETGHRQRQSKARAKDKPGTPSAPNRHRTPAGSPNPTNHGPQKPARSPAEIEPGQIPTGPEKARHRAGNRPYRATGQAGPKIPYNNSETGPEIPGRSTPGRACSDPVRATCRPGHRPPVFACSDRQEHRAQDTAGQGERPRATQHPTPPRPPGRNGPLPHLEFATQF
jgi:hypothetical protein